MKRIGLFGGTFNPIHLGHLQIVREISEHFFLHHVFIIPAAVPPHKSGQDIASADDRFEMARMATLNESDRIIISDIELKREGPSYTIDTVRYFKSIYSNNFIFFLIMGMDAILEINTWKSYRELLSETPVIVKARWGKKNCEAQSNAETLNQYLKKNISDEYSFIPSENRFCRKGYQDIYYFTGEMIGISSTDIRSRLKKRMLINGMVPDSVNEFIMRKGLYL